MEQVQDNQVGQSVPQNEENKSGNLNSPKKQKESLDIQKKLQLSRLLRKYLKVDHPLMYVKHKNCKHENGCLTSIVDLAFQGGAFGYLVKTALNVIVFLMKNPLMLFKKPHYFLMLFFQKDTFKQALFPCMYNLVLQSITCIVRRLRNADLTNEENLDEREKKIRQLHNFIDSFAAGFLAGFISLSTKPKNSRAIWGLFLLTRAFECIYNSLINKKYIPYTKFNWILIFSLMWINQGYNIAMEPANCPPSFNSFISKSMAQDVGDHTLNFAWINKKNKELKEYYGNQIADIDPIKYIRKPTKQVNLFGFKS